MISLDGNISFRSEKEVDAFCKWFLRISVSDIRDEFKSKEEWNDFKLQRDRRLKVQIDDLRKLKFNSPMINPIKNVTYFKIVKKGRKSLSSEGAAKANSRFNYKNNDEFRNRVIYFGQDKSCCYTEMFHLDIQKANYQDIVKEQCKRSSDELEYEFKPYEYEVFEYKISMDNILVLTAESSYKALGIPDRVVKDEWFSINDEFEIPTSGQILATIVRKRGYKGIMYTSVRTQTKYNLVLFEENTGKLDFKIENQYSLSNEDIL